MLRLVVSRFEKRDEIVPGPARREQVHVESWLAVLVGEQREAPHESVGLCPAFEERADEMKHARDIHPRAPPRV